jgi:hypothetical protein
MIETLCPNCKSDLLDTLQMVELVTVIRVTPVCGVESVEDNNVTLYYDYDQTEEEDSAIDPVERDYECGSCGTEIALEDVPSLYGVTL